MERQKVVDPRTVVPSQFGWLEDGSDLAHWASCECALRQAFGINQWTMHNAMYDATILHHLGVPFPESGIHDTMLMASVLGYQDISLKGLCQELFGVRTVGYTEASPGDPQYLAQDLFLTRRLRDRLQSEIRGTAYDIDRSLVPMLVEASFRGYEVDHEMLESRIADAEKARDRARAMVEPLLPRRTCRDCTDGNRPATCTEGHIMTFAGHCRGRHRSTDVASWKPCKSCEGAGTLPASLDSYDQLQDALGVETASDFLRDLVGYGGQLGEIAQWLLLYREHNDLLNSYLCRPMRPPSARCGPRQGLVVVIFVLWSRPLSPSAHTKSRQ